MELELVIIPPPNTIMPRAAPKAAPWETPRVEAEARGLRSTHCITAPEAARIAPISMAASTRGSRMFRMAVTCLASPPPKKTCRISAGRRRMEPMPMYSSAAVRVTSSARTSAACLRRV